MLDARDERGLIARRHAEYYRSLFKRAEDESAARPTNEWLADYGREIDNLRAALDWAFSPSGDGSIGVQLTAAAVPLWLRLSLLEEFRSRAKRALGALETVEAWDPRDEMKLHVALGDSTPVASEMGAAFAKALDLARRALATQITNCAPSRACTPIMQGAVDTVRVCHLRKSSMISQCVGRTRAIGYSVSAS